MSVLVYECELCQVLFAATADSSHCYDCTTALAEASFEQEESTVAEEEDYVEDPLNTAFCIHGNDNCAECEHEQAMLDEQLEDQEREDEHLVQLQAAYEEWRSAGNA